MYFSITAVGGHAYLTVVVEKRGEVASEFIDEQPISTKHPEHIRLTNAWTLV
jgi:hypothetical protein